MQLEFSQKALKDIRTIDKIAAKQIVKKLQFFVESPEPLKYAKKLTRFEGGDYRFRIGVYRIVFDVIDENIYVLRIQHRKEVYK